MSTRSTIGVRMPNGYIHWIYCHFDGYPSHHMPILENYYNTQEKVESLIHLGDMSILDKSNDCPEGHSFESPVDGYCIYYNRDRGENTTYHNAISKLDIEEQRYNYLFDDNVWKII